MYKIIALQKVSLPSLKKKMKAGEILRIDSITEKQNEKLTRAAEVGLIKFIEEKKINTLKKSEKKSEVKKKPKKVEPKVEEPVVESVVEPVVEPEPEPEVFEVVENPEEEIMVETVEEPKEEESELIEFYKESDKMTSYDEKYYCTECKRNHYSDSTIGAEHIKYKGEEN